MDARESLKRKRSSKPSAIDQVSQLHRKNPYYENLPDFAALSLQYPQILGEYVRINPVSKKGHVDFTQNDALRALSKALLLKDFGVDVDIPKDHLCPPLPNRLNYLCWISDLLEHSTNKLETHIPTVLDVGVGPVCIYPILGSKLFGWRFVGSDVDLSSVTMSQQTLDANLTLKQSIRVVHVSDSNDLQERIATEVLPNFQKSSQHADSGLGLSLHSIRNSSEVDHAHNDAHLGAHTQRVLPLRGPVCSVLQALGGVHAQTLTHCEQDHITTQRATTSTSADTGTIDSTITTTRRSDRLFDVVMTNPPFYDTHEEIQAAEHTVCNGSTSEMRTLGGEVAFVAAIIYDSLLLRDRVLWYTAMVGKHASLLPLMHLLTASGVPRAHIFVTTLMQGLTHRWALAWTFCLEAAAAYKAFCVQTEASEGLGVRDNRGTDVGERNESGVVVVHAFKSTIQYKALLDTMLTSDSAVLSAGSALMAGLSEVDACCVSTIARMNAVYKNVMLRVLAAVADINVAATMHTKSKIGTVSNTSNTSNTTNASTNNTTLLYKLTDAQCNLNTTTLHFTSVTSDTPRVEAYRVHYTIHTNTNMDTNNTAEPDADQPIVIDVGIHGVTGSCEKWR